MKSLKMNEKGQISSNGIVVIITSAIAVAVGFLAFNQVALAGNIGTISMLNIVIQNFLPLTLLIIGLVVLLSYLKQIG